MRIHRLQFDFDFQVLRYAGTGNIGQALRFRGTSRSAGWAKVAMYVENPLLPAPDLWFPGTDAAVAFDPKSLPSRLQGHLEGAGELLPIAVERNADLLLLNVTQVVNALDHDRTKWRTAPDGSWRYIDHAPGSMAFHEDRFNDSSLFKIPEDNGASIYCWEREGDPQEEFKAAVEAEAAKGLKWVLVWEG